MSVKTISLILLALCHVLNLSLADPQNEQYSALDSFNLGYTNPFSSLSDTEAGAIQQPFNIPSFHQPTLQYQKNHNGDIQEDDVSQVAGGRFLWTIYVTATKYRGTYLKTIYCTTSTAAISICTPSAGRRKRFSKGIRGLFYNDKEDGNSAIDDDANDQLHTFSIEKKQDDEALFVDDGNAEQRNRTDITSTDPKMNDETIESKNREARKAQDFPFNLMSPPDLHSGFRNGGGRFVPVYATVTTWIRAPRTYVSTITAICKSTTAFRNCNANIYGGSTDWSVYDYDY